MITKHKIIAAYSVQQTCDKCKTIMLPSVYHMGSIENEFKDGFYTSTCPKCGNVVNTGKTQYPFTQISYEMPGEEVK
jgi:RNase P subunit RPR2